MVLCMTLVPDPVWPVVVLAGISFIDGVLCVRPARFIAECFRDVGWPRRWWRVMPVIKFAATVGLLAGIWIPVIGLVTSACLVVYFLTAIVFHIRAHDFGRNLFLNATVMLAICLTVLVWCFLH